MISLKNYLDNNLDSVISEMSNTFDDLPFSSFTYKDSANKGEGVHYGINEEEIIKKASLPNKNLDDEIQVIIEKFNNLRQTYLKKQRDFVPNIYCSVKILSKSEDFRYGNRYVATFLDGGEGFQYDETSLEDENFKELIFFTSSTDRHIGRLISSSKNHIVFVATHALFNNEKCFMFGTKEIFYAPNETSLLMLSLGCIKGLMSRVSELEEKNKKEKETA